MGEEFNFNNCTMCVHNDDGTITELGEIKKF